MEQAFLLALVSVMSLPGKLCKLAVPPSAFLRRTLFIFFFPFFIRPRDSFNQTLTGLLITGLLDDPNILRFPTT
ncbi:hypothetical protein SODALDRAFT_334148, partial [Sodiomyces alkalinus F11]